MAIVAAVTAGAARRTAVLLVLCPRVALAHTPVHPTLEGFLQVGRGGRDHALRADTDGDVVKEALRELLLDGPDVLLAQVGAQQAHAAIDVKAHAAR